MHLILNVWIFFILLLARYCSTDDTVRLILGQGPHMGLVQISHAGRSGLVCDDDFSESAAKVVCRQIGYPTTNPKFQTDGKFKPLPNGMDYILDDVRCTGNEASLSDCTHSTWFKHDCSGPETVAVTCDDNCLSSPCQNNGKCISLENTYNCTCLYDWSGRNCQKVSGETLTCSSQQMTISFRRDRFPALHEQYMTLRDTTCHATGNSTHITLTTPLDGCGTKTHKDGDNMIYDNVVKSQEVVVEGVISRVREITVPFQCVVAVVNNLEVPIDVQLSHLHFSIEAQGVFDIRLELFHDEHFNRTPEDPFYITPGDTMYLQLNMTSDDNLSPFAIACDATPVRSRAIKIYSIIQHGCASDDSVKFLPNPVGSVQRFSMEAFKYIDNSPAVYLHCDVIVCDSSDTSSRCASGCFTTNPGRRAARDVARAAMSGGFRLEGRYLNSQSMPGSKAWSQVNVVIFWSGLTAVGGAAMLLLGAIVYNYRRLFVKKRPVFYLQH